MDRLYDALIQYAHSDNIPFHMPGHKRRLMEFENPYRFDITEIDGFDDLHHASGILKEAQQYAAAVCGADETHFLVNGSSGGILSAVFSATEQNGEIIMARNCHRSVYHAAELRQLKTHYIYPRLLPEGISGDISVEMAEEAFLKYPKAKALILTSPTYDGVVSDIRGIARAAHARGVTVIVDEAHGAHFLEGSSFPESAVSCGADVVVQSVHKTLPALTQTALLHMRKDYPGRERARRFLMMFQTSSPSYVLMASIDTAMHWYAEKGREAYGIYVGRLKKLRSALGTELKHLKLLTPEDVFDYDISKILISTAGCGISGKELHRILLESFHIQSEMVSARYVLFMTSVADTEEAYEKFLEALIKIDGTLEAGDVVTKQWEQERPGQAMPIFEAVEAPKRAAALSRSVGKISASYLYLYPPGIPLLAPGEIISEECAEKIGRYVQEGLEVRGLTAEKEIEILWDEFFT